MVHFQRFEDLETLAEMAGARFVRVRDLSTDATYVLKTGLGPVSPGLLLRLCNHHAVGRQALCGAVIKPLELLQDEGRYGLLLDDVQAVPMATWMEREWPKRTTGGQHPAVIRPALVMGLQLVEALRQLHQQGILHLGITDRSVWVTRNGDIRLADLSAASRLTLDAVDRDASIDLAALAYLAPEQTGRMNRSVDLRSDLYSVGVLLYQMLGAQTPFPAGDALDLIAHHLLMPPKPLSSLNAAVSPSLEAVVHTLLEKNPEQRYQGCQGLLHDLQLCLQELDQKPDAGLDAQRLWPVRSQDGGHDFQVSERLFGRDREVASLLEEFDRVAGPAGNQARLVLVGGPPGVGKSAIVAEVHRPVVRRKGRFLKGKFDQVNQGQPYGAFVQALEQLVNQMLDAEPERLRMHGEHLREQLGSGAGRLLVLLPQLEALIGVQEPLAPMVSAEVARRQMDRLLELLLSEFSSRTSPLVVFLDDLQWADLASLQLMEHLLARATVPGLLLIGAYRTNEVDELHPLRISLRELSGHGVQPVNIEIKPLTSHNVNELVATSLGCGVAQAWPLSEIVFRRTEGNPLYVRQFLKALHKRGLIFRQFGDGVWQCDLSATRALAVTDDIVDFLSLEMRLISSSAQHVLTVAACLGNRFSIDAIMRASGLPEPEVTLALWEALQSGFILPATDLYKFYQPGAEREVFTGTSLDPQYRFLHDRVQQTCYQLIGAEGLAELHLALGRRMLALHVASGGDRPVDDTEAVLQQYNKVIERLVDDSERLQVARLNRSHAQHNKASAAFEEAAACADTALRLLPATQGPNERTAWTIEAIELHFMAGHFDLAESLAATVLEGSCSELDRARTTNLLVQVKVARNQLEEALNLGLAAVSRLGFEMRDMPQGPQDWPALPTWDELDAMPLCEDPAVICALDIQMSLTPAAYITSFPLYVRLVLTMVSICIRHGHSPLAPVCYTNYGLALCGTGQIGAGDQAGRIAMALLERLQVRAGAVRVETLLDGFVFHWKDPLGTCAERLLRHSRVGLDQGDLEYVGYASFLYSDKALWTSLPLGELIARQELLLEVTARYKLDFSNKHCAVWWQGARCFAGQMSTSNGGVAADGFDALAFDRLVDVPYLREVRNDFSLASAYALRIALAFTFDDLDVALDSAEAFKPYQLAGSGTLASSQMVFFHALTQLARQRHGQVPDAESSAQAIATAQSHLAAASSEGPANFEHRAMLLNAEMARTEGRSAQAAALYPQAAQRARQGGFLAEEGLIHRLAADFHVEMKQPDEAAHHAMAALFAYESWGALGVKRWLMRRFPQWLTDAQGVQLESAVALAGQALEIKHLNERLDLTAVVRAQQTLSQEVDYERLVDRFLQIIMSNSGAQRAMLLLENDGQRQIVASCEIGAQTDLQPVTMDSSAVEARHLSAQIVHHVWRTNATVVLADSGASGPFSADPALASAPPMSIMCLPIPHQGRPIGVLYLQNSLSTHVFSMDRQQVASTLCSQAAILIQNARFYGELELRAKYLAAINRVLGVEGVEEAPSAAPSSSTSAAMDERFFRHLFKACEELLESTNAARIAIVVNPNTHDDEGLLVDTPAGSAPQLFMSSRLDRRGDGPPDHDHIIESPEGALGDILVWLGNAHTGVADTPNPRRLGELNRTLIASVASVLSTAIEARIRRGKESALRSVFDAMDQSVVIFDAQGHELIRNDQAFDLGTLPGTPERRDSQGTKLVRDAMFDGMRRSGASAEVLKAGMGTFDLQIAPERVVHTALRPLQGGSLAVVMTDVSEIRATERQLKQAENLSALGTLISSVAHDFNNYLFVVTSTLDTLLDNPSLPEDDRPLVDRAIRASRLASRVTRSLLGIGRKAPMVPKRTDVREVLANVADMAQPLMGSRITCTVEVSTGRALWTDTELLEGTLINLVKNACRAMPKGGRITLKAHDASEDRVCIDVCDTGTGIPPEQLDKIFQPFVTLDTSGSGTGLGLTIAQRFVEESGGSIAVQSQLGVGTTLSLHLPSVI